MIGQHRNGFVPGHVPLPIHTSWLAGQGGGPREQGQQGLLGLGLRQAELLLRLLLWGVQVGGAMVSPGAQGDRSDKTSGQKSNKNKIHANRPSLGTPWPWRARPS